MERIHQYISELLSEHDCVIIPTFGAFIADYCPARIGDDEGTVPSKDIVFNRNLTRNDGLLINAIIEDQNIGYKEAKEQIENYVSETALKLTAGEEIIFAGVGVLRQDEIGFLHFKADKNNSLLRHAYGLKPIALQKINPETNPVASPKEQTVPESDSTKRASLVPRKNRNLLRAATTVAVIVILIILSTPLSDEPIVDQASMGPVVELGTPSATITDAKLNTPATVSSGDTRSLPLSRKAPEVSEEVVAPEAVVPVEYTEEAILEVPVETDAYDGPTYHIIVASLLDASKAQVYQQRFQKQYELDKVIIVEGDSRYRVSVAQFRHEASAKSFAKSIRRFNPKLKDAWVLKQ